MSVYERYNLDKEKVIAWAKKHYPHLVSKPNTIAMLYLKEVMKIVPEAPHRGGRKYTLTKYSELKKSGNSGVLRVVIIEQVDEFEYTGCPQCMRRLVNQNGKMVCPEHGEVKGEVFCWRVYTGMDLGDDVQITVRTTPRVKEVLESGVTYDLFGRVRNGVFYVPFIKRRVDDKQSVEQESKLEFDKKLAGEINTLLNVFGDDGIVISEFQKFLKNRGVDASVEEVAAVYGLVIENGHVKRGSNA